MYKMVAIDLDGTLLNSTGEISSENMEALRQVRDNGMEVVIASGRLLESVIDFSNEIGNLHYAISGNGSILYDIKADEVLYNNNMTKDKVLQIIKICEENSIYYSVYTSKEVIARGLDHNVLVYQNDNLHRKTGNVINIIVVQDVYSYIQFLDVQDFSKVCICDEDKEVFSSIMKRLRNIPDTDVLEVAHMSRKTIKIGTETLPIEYFYTEIKNENVNKWNAINVLIDKIGIDKDNVICIGDNINDKEMIENAGLGIAMGNANPHVKAVANAVTLDNNSNGVATILTQKIIKS